jgi:ppGpp synthetase/RelA/SpoT-type nucleotidyltranferase
LAEAERTAEDRLREEYFTLLPEIHRVADRLEAEIRYHMLPISGRLERHERLAVKCRVKSCESALEKLRARQEGRTFQRSRPEIYTLTSLNDLAGVRVLAFPRRRLAEIDRKLRKVFSSWTAAPSKTTATFRRSNTTARAGRATRSRENIRSSRC